MALADVHCILPGGGGWPETMNHYDIVTGFYSLRQSAKAFLKHHFTPNLSVYESRFMAGLASSSCHARDKQLRVHQNVLA